MHQDFADVFETIVVEITSNNSFYIRCLTSINMIYTIYHYMNTIRLVSQYECDMPSIMRLIIIWMYNMPIITIRL